MNVIRFSTNSQQKLIRVSRILPIKEILIYSELKQRFYKNVFSLYFPVTFCRQNIYNAYSYAINEL